MNDKINPNKKPDVNASCFLTTATVNALGLPDDCEPLELARFLRDEKMTSSSDQAAVDLYYKVAPTIVDRSTEAEWVSFWDQHMRKITALIKEGEYELAKDMYTFATASLINQKATHYSDVEMVDDVYEFGLKDVGKSVLPYPVRFALLKTAFAAGLTYQRIRLGLAQKKHANILEV